MTGNIEREPQGCLFAVKQAVAERFPGPYSGARNIYREARRRTADLREFPYVTAQSIGDVRFLMRVTSRQEQSRVEGRYFEGELLAEILNRIQPGDVVFDIGAATGTHTIPSAIKTGITGQVFSFEPDPSCVKVLKRNVNLNHLKNIVVLKTALWDQDTCLEIHTNGKGGEAAQVTEIGQPIQKKLKHRHLIGARSIASLVENGIILPPDILKIDVEGGGIHVLKGMRDLRPRDIFIEVHPKFGEDRDETINLLQERGYQLVTESPRQNEIHLHFHHNPLANS